MNDRLVVRLPGKALAACAALLFALHVASCGGGVGSGGTGAPLASTASGTVTGFGSVLVDGVRYDDTDADVTVEQQPGVVANTALRIGDSVEVEVDAPGSASAFAVEPRLVAPLEAIDGSGRLRVLGQTVQANADPGAGPVTLFGGSLAGIGSLAPGDLVEVHGFVAGGAGAERLQATRIERRNDAPAQWRIVGRVADLESGRRFAIGQLTVDLAGATVLPSGTALADGQTVVAFGRTAPGDSRGLLAVAVRVFGRASAPGLPAQIGGRVRSLDANGFVLDNVRVESGTAEVAPAGLALADGLYVQVAGSYRDDGALLARRIEIRVPAAAAVELAGTLFDVDAAAQTARLRDTPIAIAGTQLQGCGAAGLADGRYVELRGMVAGAGIVAESIRCRDEPADATIERRGIAGPLHGQRFELMPQDGEAPIDVRVDRRTFWNGVGEATLAGARVRVEGRFRGNMLLARSISVL